MLGPILAFGIWSSDFITLQGERTVYTVECDGGAWEGERCSGTLRAGDRYRFRALKAHGEVLFWTAGAAEASGRFTGCRITNGRDWQCSPNGSEGATVTLQMKGGRPVTDRRFQTRSFRQVSKWRWYLLHWGLPAGSSAEAPTPRVAE